MVQQRFQNVLDDYINKTEPDLARADQALREGTEWDSRWGGGFER